MHMLQSFAVTTAVCCGWRIDLFIITMHGPMNVKITKHVVMLSAPSMYVHSPYIPFIPLSTSCPNIPTQALLLTWGGVTNSTHFKLWIMLKFSV